MAFITYPLNNIQYTAEDAELYNCTRTSGIWADDSFTMSVTGNDNNITVGSGLAWINNEKFSGKVAAMKETETLDMGVADSVYPRYDAVVIRFNANRNATEIAIKQGTPSTSPNIPARIQTSALYELYLAYVYRPAGATTVKPENVTDCRFNDYFCGLMADAVSNIDTSVINAQISAFIENFKSQSNASLANVQEELESIKDSSGLMLRSDFDPDGNKVIPMLRGGTGATTPDGARKNMGINTAYISSISVPPNKYVDIECELLTMGDLPAVPNVYISMVSTSTSLGMADIEPVMLSRSATSVTIRVYNKGTTERKPGFCIMAIG